MKKEQKVTLPKVMVSHFTDSGGASQTNTYKEELTPARYTTVLDKDRVQLASWREFRGTGAVTIMVTIAHEDVPAYAATLLAAWMKTEQAREEDEQEAEVETTFLTGAFNGLIP